MARIRNTFRPNIPGDGYEKEITLDNGEKYIIRNTFRPNIPGDGYEQEIVKVGDTNKGKTSIGEMLIGLLAGLIGIGYLVFILFLFLNVGYIGIFFAIFIPIILVCIANNTIYKNKNK